MSKQHNNVQLAQPAETPTPMNNNHQKIRLSRDKGMDLVFTGSLVAEVTSDPTKQGPRWTILKLYVTKAGKFISQSIGMSLMPNEGNISNCEVFKSLDEAAEFFTHRGKVTWLSVEMFSEIKNTYPDFDHAEIVE